MKIDGKEFRFVSSHKSKITAKLKAQKIRARGKKARVLKLKDERTGKTKWGIFRSF